MPWMLDVTHVPEHETFLNADGTKSRELIKLALCPKAL